MCAAACLVCAAGLVACIFIGIDHPGLMMIALILGIMGQQSIAPTFWALPTAMLSGVAAAGGIALINSVGQPGRLSWPLHVWVDQGRRPAATRSDCSHWPWRQWSPPSCCSRWDTTVAWNVSLPKPPPRSRAWQCSPYNRAFRREFRQRNTAIAAANTAAINVGSGTAGTAPAIAACAGAACATGTATTAGACATGMSALHGLPLSFIASRTWSSWHISSSATLDSPMLNSSAACCRRSHARSAQVPPAAMPKPATDMPPEAPTAHALPPTTLGGITAGVFRTV